jgi:hypothetical protein
MRIAHRHALILSVVLLSSTVVVLGQDAPKAAPPQLSKQEMETFLLKGKITKKRDAGGGVTSSMRATMTDGTITHDVHIQNVDIAQSVFEAGKATELNFKDSYRYNIAGYRLAQLIGLPTVPMSVERTIDSKPSAVTWWVDGVKMDEKERLKQKTLGPDPVRTTKQLQVMRVFDELIQNRDRNQGNILWSSDSKMWLIDHTRAFRLGRDLQTPGNLTRIDRSMFEKMRGLDKQAFTDSIGKTLSKDEIEALFIRRDKLVQLFDQKISVLGEDKVLYTIR